MPGFIDELINSLASNKEELTLLFQQIFYFIVERSKDRTVVSGVQNLIEIL